MSAAVRFRNKRGRRGANTAANMAGTRYDVHRASDNRYVGQVEREAGLWIMRYFDGRTGTVDILDDRHRAEIGANREACGERVLVEYELLAVKPPAERDDPAADNASGYGMAGYAAALPATFARNFGSRFNLIGFRPMTEHPDDAYLFVVIAEREDGTFAKWAYNASDSCFSGGHYDIDLRRALDLLCAVSS